jgi:hypothetical protein
MKQRPPAELQVPFDRVTYRDGQLLASSDLRDDSRSNERLRRMHTRFLHATWGIGLGFTVNAQISDDMVHIGPGYAIDISAREILLADDIALPIPVTAAATDLMLVIGYLEDSAYIGLPDLAKLCTGSGLDRRDEKPVFNWRTPDTLNLGLDVPLARVHVQNGALTLLPDLSVRRYAKRMTRPHIASGELDYTPTRRNLAGTIPVDTSDAGFANTPAYFVRLDAAGVGLADLGAQFLANSAYIHSASSKGFLYVVPGLAGLANPNASPPVQLIIKWIGVEPVGGCEPVPNALRIFLANGLLRSAILKQGVFK